MVSLSDEALLRKLVGLYEEDVVVRAIVDWLAARQRAPKNGTVRADVVRRELQKAGYMASVDEVRGALEEIATTGAGTYTNGRPVKQSRLEFRGNAKELATEVIDTSRVGSGPIPSDSSALRVSREVDEGIFYLPLSQGRRLRIDLPEDTSSGELRSLARFFEVLADSREAA